MKSRKRVFIFCYCVLGISNRSEIMKDVLYEIFVFLLSPISMRKISRIEMALHHSFAVSSASNKLNWALALFHRTIFLYVHHKHDFIHCPLVWFLFLFCNSYDLFCIFLVILIVFSIVNFGFNKSLAMTVLSKSATKSFSQLPWVRSLLLLF